MSIKVVENENLKRSFLAILECCYSHTGYTVVRKVWARWARRHYGVEEARERAYDLTDKWVDGNLLAAFCYLWRLCCLRIALCFLCSPS